MPELKHAEWIDLVRLQINPSSKGIEVAEKVKINSTEYRKGSFVLLSLSEQGFLFGKITCVVRDDPQIPLLVLSCYETLCFDQLSFSHRIVPKFPQQYQVCCTSMLLDYHPLDGVVINGNIYIRMKYFVLGNSTH